MGKKLSFNLLHFKDFRWRFRIRPIELFGYLLIFMDNLIVNFLVENQVSKLFPFIKIHLQVIVFIFFLKRYSQSVWCFRHRILHFTTDCLLFYMKSNLQIVLVFYLWFTTFLRCWIINFCYLKWTYTRILIFCSGCFGINSSLRLRFPNFIARFCPSYSFRRLYDLAFEIVFLSFLRPDAFQWCNIDIRLALFDFKHDLYLIQEGNKILLILGKEIDLNLSQILIVLGILNFIENALDKLNMVMSLWRKGFFWIDDALLDGWLHFFMNYDIKFWQLFNSLLGERHLAAEVLPFLGRKFVVGHLIIVSEEEVIFISDYWTNGVWNC